jgi:hypothetical protein
LGEYADQLEVIAAADLFGANIFLYTPPDAPLPKYITINDTSSTTNRSDGSQLVIGKPETTSPESTIWFKYTKREDGNTGHYEAMVQQQQPFSYLQMAQTPPPRQNKPPTPTSFATNISMPQLSLSPPFPTNYSPTMSPHPHQPVSQHYPYQQQQQQQQQPLSYPQWVQIPPPQQQNNSPTLTIFATNSSMPQLSLSPPFPTNYSQTMSRPVSSHYHHNPPQPTHMHSYHTGSPLQSNHCDQYDDLSSQTTNLNHLNPQSVSQPTTTTTTTAFDHSFNDGQQLPSDIRDQLMVFLAKENAKLAKKAEELAKEEVKLAKKAEVLKAMGDAVTIREQKVTKREVDATTREQKVTKREIAADNSKANVTKREEAVNIKEKELAAKDTTTTEAKWISNPKRSQVHHSNDRDTDTDSDSDGETNKARKNKPNPSTKQTVKALSKKAQKAQSNLTLQLQHPQTATTQLVETEKPTEIDPLTTQLTKEEKSIQSRKQKKEQQAANRRQSYKNLQKSSSTPTDTNVQLPKPLDPEEFKQFAKKQSKIRSKITTTKIHCVFVPIFFLFRSN